MIELKYAVDGLWCDMHGVYAAGWAHVGAPAVQAVWLRSGEFQAASVLIDRPDLRAFFPELSSVRCGFSIYLPCPPFKPVWLGVQTAEGAVETELEPPIAEHLSLAFDEGRAAPLDAFIAEMRERGGTVLEIGARAVSPGATLKAPLFGPNCRVLGVDIHAAPGVDVVCDAHVLSTAIAPGSVAGVFSLAVMEHLAAPWLVAAEINRVLEPGGLTLHVAPQSFPVHEQPNDFWRMTDEALKVLFGPHTGFEVVEAGMATPMQMICSPALRTGPFLAIPLARGMASSYILARKIADLPSGAVAWPMRREALEAQSRTYPAHGATTPRDASV